MSRPTVFIVQEPWPDRDTGERIRDFTPAERFGDLKILLPHDHGPSSNLGLDLIEAGLRDYSTSDYIVCSGHPAAIGVATAIVSRFGPVKLLIWSGRTREYNVIYFDPAVIEHATVG